MVMLFREAETEYIKHIAITSNMANSFMPVAFRGFISR